MDKGFFKAHADTLAIIAINLAAIAILTSMWISNTHRVDATNARLDNTYSMLCDMIKDSKK